MINKKQFSQKTIKRSILFVLLFLAFFTSRIKAQGVDAVFFLDNSSSIDDTEWIDMSNSTKALIDGVLECNVNNRIAVAHFAGFYTEPDAISTDPRIFLDENFTNNAATAKSFVRRGGEPSQGGTHYATMGNETWLHENIALLQNSLGSSTASPQIVSTLKKLNRNPNNKLVIFIFTDAPATGNGLTRASSFGSGGPFDNYNIIKTSLGATIVMIHATTGEGLSADIAARAAAAAIASVGGSYNGTVQANAGDPQGSGTKPRKAVMSNVFDISNIDIVTIADNICKSCAPTVEIDAITPPTQDVCKNGTAQALVSNAVGTGTLSYQWYSNTTNSTTGGTLISGATSDTYAPPTSVLGTTYYFVEVADTFCEGKTKSAVVSVTITTCCNAGTSAPALAITTISPAPATIADLIATLSASNTPAGANFTIHSSSEATDANKLATSTAVIAGNTYYVAFWDSINNCYSPTSQVYIAIPDSCLPDPYAAQQTWWFGFGRGESESTRYGHIIRIDFQTGTAVLNNPPTGFLGQGDDTLGYEGHTNVTNPVTGEFLFGTDGNTIYRASDGTKATGGGIGGHFSAGQAAAVIPDPEGVLGKDFIVFGNTSNTSDQPAGLNMGKYNLENNTVLGITNLLADNATTGILEALQVVPKSNGRDYWILVISANAKVRVYEYTIAGGFNPSIISEISIPNTLGTTILGTSLSWIPQQENKIVIGMGYTVGMVDFNLNTGVLANYETKVTTTNVVSGYSPVISPNGKYLYHVNSVGGLDYINLSDNTQTTIFPPNTTVGVYGIKVGPDGRLYFVNGTTDTVWYIDDANNPPTGIGSASHFLTGVKKSSLALPNNTYWSCEITVCQTGTDAPVLASTTISSLPATVTDLISVLEVSNLPANTVLTIHSGSPATDSNQLASSIAIVAGSTYYVAFWDEFYGCYSPTTEINVINDTSTDCEDANRILHGDFTSLPASPGFKTASEIATLTNNKWTLTATNNSAVFWGHTTNLSFGNGLQFIEDNQVQTLTQSLTNVNNLGTGHFPKLSISKFAAINGLGGSVDPLERGRSSTLIISYAGVEYAKVVTANGENTDATLTYSNGATGSISTLLVGTVYNNWIIILPSTVPQNGDLLFHFISGSGDANGGADDFAIGNLSICPPPYCTKPGAAGTPLFTNVGISTFEKQTAGWPENVPNGFIALESKDKGFVITRVAHVGGGTDGSPDLVNDAITDPKEGMLVYDIEDECVKLFNGTIWSCIERSCND